MILTGKKPDIIGNLPGEIAREGDRIGAGDGLPADFDFSAPFTHDLIFERGVGTATFARTTTGFIPDNLGIFNSIDIAAARFKGARYLGSGLFSNLDSIGDPIPQATLKGFLSEDQRTNDILWSRNYGNVAWIKVGTPVYAQDETGIDGQSNQAWTLSDNSIAARSGFRQFINMPAGNATIVASAFIKKDNDETRFPEINLIAFGDVTNNISAQLNTKTGATIIVNSAGIVSINAVSIDNWWFVWVSVGNISVGASSVRFQISPASSTTWGVLEATATGSVIADVSQVEHNVLFPSSPIITDAGSVSRTKDLLYYPVSGNMENNNLSCFIKWTPSQDDLGTVFIWASYVDADNYTALLHDGTDLIIRKRISSVNNDATITLDYDNNVTYKIGWRFSELDGIDIWLDGIKGNNDADIADIQLGTNFEIGSDGNSANYDFSYHKENESWNRTLSDSEMAALTT